MDDFASLDTPGDPGGVKVVEISGFEIYFSCFGMVAPGGFFSLLLKCCPMSALKVWPSKKCGFFGANSHNFKSFKKIHSLKP